MAAGNLTTQHDMARGVDDSATEVDKRERSEAFEPARADSLGSSYSALPASSANQPSPSSSSPPPPFQARFWDSDPVTQDKRKLYLRIIVGASVAIILIIFAALPIFWGSLFRVNEYVHKLNGWVIDFDGGPIGQAVIQAIQNNTGRPDQLSWHVVEASQFPNGLSDVEDAVVQDKTWVAVTINRGASTNLSAAITSVDGSYNGSFAVTAYAAEARNENGYGSYILPNIMTPLTMAAEAFAVQNSRQLATNSSVDVTTLLSQAPTVVNQPLYYTIANIRPFDVPVAQAVGYIGLIYLLIISFIVCMMNYQARVLLSGLNRHLRLSSLIMLRMAIPFILYFFISVFFSMLSLAFQAPFNRVFGSSGFVIYWMMNWMGMCSLGLAMESLITILTPAFVPLFLILWIISNVSVASVPIEVLPGVFKYGYATPFYNVSQTVKTILFNTRNQVGLNFGVQIAWIAVSLVTMSLFTALMRKKDERAWVRQEEALRNKEKV